MFTCNNNFSRSSCDIFQNYQIYLIIIEAYPTTADLSLVISPLVAYLSNFPSVEPSSFAVAIRAAIAPYPQAEIFNRSKIL
jgi:hypothetical protein